MFENRGKFEDCYEIVKILGRGTFGRLRRKRKSRKRNRNLGVLGV